MSSTSFLQTTYFTAEFNHFSRLLVPYASFRYHGALITASISSARGVAPHCVRYYSRIRRGCLSPEDWLGGRLCARHVPSGGNSARQERRHMRTCSNILRSVASIRLPVFRCFLIKSGSRITHFRAHCGRRLSVTSGILKFERACIFGSLATFTLIRLPITIGIRINPNYQCHPMKLRRSRRRCREAICCLN